MISGPFDHDPIPRKYEESKPGGIPDFGFLPWLGLLLLGIFGGSLIWTLVLHAFRMILTLWRPSLGLELLKVLFPLAVLVLGFGLWYFKAKNQFFYGLVELMVAVGTAVDIMLNWGPSTKENPVHAILG